MRAVLTFHGIDRQDGPLSCAPRDFDAMLAAFARTGIPVLDLDRLLGPDVRHGVALTFDDGLRSLFTDALPILREHHAPAHLFLCTDALQRGAAAPGSDRDMLTWDMLGKLHDSGLAIEAHTHRHLDLRQLSDEEIVAECATADALIERRTGRRPRYFAYPFGRHDRRVIEQIRPRYAAAFTTRLAFLASGDSPSSLPRLDAHYLRSPLVYGRLQAHSTRWYLRLRGLMRIARGSESISLRTGLRRDP
jgi:peptidoglycan/xylan/chitin deacetylase (PgdA/CDA1 family)